MSDEPETRPVGLEALDIAWFFGGVTVAFAVGRALFAAVWTSPRPQRRAARVYDLEAERARRRAPAGAASSRARGRAREKTSA